MKIFFFCLIALAVCAGLWAFLSPKKQTKSKTEKQAELMKKFEKKLSLALENIHDSQEAQKIKIATLKQIAKELEFNIFFDQEETKAMLKELASKF